MQLSKNVNLIAMVGALGLLGAMTVVGCYEPCERYVVEGDYMVCADDEGEGDGDGDGDGDDDGGGKSTSAGTASGGGTTTSGGGTTTSGGGTTTSGGGPGSCTEACAFIFAACPAGFYQGDEAACNADCPTMPANVQECFFCAVAACNEDPQSQQQLCGAVCDPNG